MATPAREERLAALAERSSYVENILRHSLVATLSSLVWSRDPRSSLQVFNSEVDDSGFDLVLGLASMVRYVQLKQAHDEKVPPHCSVRLSFSIMPGACVVLMSHSLAALELTGFRFFGGPLPSDPMPKIEELSHTKAPGRRSAEGIQKIRTNYRNVPVSRFQGSLSAQALLNALFPSKNAV